MDLNQQYGLRRVINACGKMTSLCGAAVLPEIIETVASSLGHFYELDELQAAAGRIIATATGSESGCVTACTAAGITTTLPSNRNDGWGLEQPPPVRARSRIIATPWRFIKLVKARNTVTASLFHGYSL